MRLKFGITKKENTPTTDINWNKLTKIDALDQIKEESANEPILIFKHSTRCPTSSMALNRLERSWIGSEVNNIKTYFLDLINYREVSNHIESSFGVLHQSPQVLIISNGKSVYDDSHFNISFENIKNVIPKVVA